MEQILEGFMVGFASFFSVAFVFAWFVSFRRKHKPQHSQAPSSWNVHHLQLSCIAACKGQWFDQSISPVSMPEILQATKNFSSDLIIGNNSSGPVYKVPLANGVTFVVKMLCIEQLQVFREFLAETEILGKLHHPNIVKILGYCADDSKRLLIYEFVERGSLDQWLYDSAPLYIDTSSPSQRLPLNWETRLKIARGVARGLAYMHNLKKPVIHRDIKASTVLLDSEFEARVADFGLARVIEGSFSHVSTGVAGTLGYIAPEYFYGATIATTMGDVYSFGVLMLEIATGRRPHLPFKLEKSWREKMSLVDWAVTLFPQGCMELIDANIYREGLPKEEFVEFFRIAFICIRDRPVDRPTMNGVVDLLNQISS